MIKLYQYPSGWDVPNLSPFCMKVETYLRMTNSSYEIIYETDPCKGPIGHMPQEIRTITADMARKKIQTDLHAHGLGRNTAAEIYQMGQENLYAVATILNDQQFMLGKKPSSIDACAYSFIFNLLKPPINTPLKSYAQSQQNLVDYCDRMHTRYYA